LSIMMKWIRSIGGSSGRWQTYICFAFEVIYCGSFSLDASVSTRSFTFLSFSSLCLFYFIFSYRICFSCFLSPQIGLGNGQRDPTIHLPCGLLHIVLSGEVFLWRQAVLNTNKSGAQVRHCGETLVGFKIGASTLMSANIDPSDSCQRLSLSIKKHS